MSLLLASALMLCVVALLPGAATRQPPHQVTGATYAPAAGAVQRVGGITQASKIAALAEAHSVPVIPHAGQMHNYHIVMASLNSPTAEYFPPVDVEVGNELFWYICRGEPKAQGGYIDLDPDVPGLGLEIDEEALAEFSIVE